MKNLGLTCCLSLMVLVSGCASMGIGQASDETLKSLTTGAVPCSKKSIVISDKTGAEGWNIWSWEVQCKDKTYFCSKGQYSTTKCATEE